MVNWSESQVNAHEARLRPKQSVPATGCDDESGLHRSILDYCNSQWPKWKVIHARMDKPSTIPVGAHDLTIFMPDGKLLCIECKKRTGKVSTDQSGWIMEMNKLGHVVEIIRDFQTFLRIVDETLTTKPHDTPTTEQHHVRD